MYTFPPLKSVTPLKAFTFKGNVAGYNNRPLDFKPRGTSGYQVRPRADTPKVAEKTEPMKEEVRSII